MLKLNITINEKIIVKGSLTINSNIDRKEFCNSNTSDEIRAIKSPFFFSEKKSRGRVVVFLYRLLRISFKTPFLRKVMKNIAK